MREHHSSLLALACALALAGGWLAGSPPAAGADPVDLEETVDLEESDETGKPGEDGELDEAEEPEALVGTLLAITFEREERSEDGTVTKRSEIWTAGEDVPRGGLEPVVAPPPGARAVELWIRGPDGDVRKAPDKLTERRVRHGRLEPGGQVGFTESADSAAVFVDRRVPSLGRRFSWLLAGLAAVLVVALVSLGKRPGGLLVGEDGRLSNSKTQIALWFGLVIGVYLSTLALRWWASFGERIAGIDIPTNLLLLSGLSVLTFAGAKGIKQGQMNEAEARLEAAEREAFDVQTEAAVASELEPATDAAVALRAQALEARMRQSAAAVQTARQSVDKLAGVGVQASWRDLVRDNDGKPDLADFQMLVVTLLAVGTFLWATLAWQAGAELVGAEPTLPDVDTTILAAFGLGQGAYLTKKYAEDPS